MRIERRALEWVNRLLLRHSFLLGKSYLFLFCFIVVYFCSCSQLEAGVYKTKQL